MKRGYDLDKQNLSRNSVVIQTLSGETQTVVLLNSEVYLLRKATEKHLMPNLPIGATRINVVEAMDPYVVADV